MNRRNFFICGLAGWCMEILFTSIKDANLTDMRLVGQTSIWMFPIYGMAACIHSIYPKIQKLPTLIRSAIYSVGILIGEFISGSLLTIFRLCPWDYSDAKYNIHGIIRLDYFPLWMLAGLVFERLLCGQGKKYRGSK